MRHEINKYETNLSLSHICLFRDLSHRDWWCLLIRAEISQNGIKRS